MQKKIYTCLILLFTMVFLAALPGCSGGSSNSKGTGTGTLSVSLTDAPAVQYDEVNITVEKVRVHQSDSATENEAGWSDITLDPPRKINLLKLTNGVLEDLGQTALPAGHYTQLRLVLSANTGTTLANSVVVAGSGEETALDTPSGIQSGIKLINAFDVAAGQRVDLVIDFNASKSVVRAGNSGKYLLKPVIKVLPMVLTGIEGYVDAALPNVVVSAQMNGDVVRSSVTDTTGWFFLSHLAAGNYDLVVIADGRAAAAIAGVPVTAATPTAVTTVVSTTSEPITLPTCTIHSLTGIISLSPASADTVASLAAMQTFTAGGPTVVVTSEAADPDSGLYAAALPACAPLLGRFGALPIAFTAQPDITGRYGVNASAEGYRPQTADVDVSAGDGTKDFILTP